MAVEALCLDGAFTRNRNYMIHSYGRRAFRLESLNSRDGYPDAVQSTAKRGGSDCAWA